VPLQTKIPPTIIAAAAAVLATNSLTDADICPLAHPPLHESNCRVRLPCRWLVTGICMREGGKCRVPAPTTAGPIATPAMHLILMDCTSSFAKCEHITVDKQAATFS